MVFYQKSRIEGELNSRCKVQRKKAEKVKENTDLAEMNLADERQKSATQGRIKALTPILNMSIDSVLEIRFLVGSGKQHVQARTTIPFRVSQIYTTK